MAETCDFLIVGGGVHGASLAYHLAARRAGRVILLEKEALAAGSTGGSGAIVRTHYSNAATARLALRSLEMFERFDEEIGGSCGFVPCGFAMAVAPGQMEGLRRNVALQRTVGIETEVLAPEEIERLLPGVRTEGLGGMAFEPRSGYADPHGTTAGYAARARELGASLRQGVAVGGLRMAGGRCLGVETQAGPIEAGVVFLAAGAWAAKMGAWLGMALPLAAIREQVAILQAPAPREIRCAMADADLGIYFWPEGEGLVLLGQDEAADVEPCDPDAFNRSTDEAFVRKVTGRLVRRFPGMAEAGVQGGWACRYCITPDWHPVIGPLPGHENVWLVAGFSGHGFKLAPAVGLAVAETVAGGGAGADLRPFRFRRFEENDPFRATFGSGHMA